MGCLGHKGLITDETKTKKISNDAQNNLSKKDKYQKENKQTSGNLITKSNILCRLQRFISHFWRTFC